MGIVELFLIAVGLSMDAFAVSICQGLSMQKAGIRKALIVGLYFGVFQAAMPLLGYLVGSQFAGMITSVDHWIAFGLLALIGANMIIGSFKADCPAEAQDVSLTPRRMLPLALATSIDALAVGVTFAFLNIEIIPAVSLIGVTTFTLSVVGVKIGGMVGGRFQAKAEFAGGVILVLMGLKILLEHTGVLPL